ncbi:hypothetical protein MNBD_GAMMA12-688 [hydrothermal vent metagenome]|uniref:histidine kinase n=1 Tax=hydrothermal vent metagenome TaxID=652676 RepID=A0A3B0ZJV2_9ZZZZ
MNNGHTLNLNSDILTSVIDQTVHGLVLVNHNNEIQYWNHWMSKKSGLNPDQVIGRNLKDIFKDSNLTRITQSITNALTKGHSSSLSESFTCFNLALFRDKRHSIKIIPQITVSPLQPDLQLCLIQITDVFTSATRERMLKSIANEAHIGKAAAENLSQLKSNFVSTVSHELRTPLTSILGTLGLLNGQVLGPLNSEQLKLLSVAHQNSELLLNLINNILDIDKIESGTIDFNFSKISINELLEKAISGIQGYGEKVNIKFTLLTSKEDYFIFADSDKLMQVLNNLLSNAAKFSQPEQTVSLYYTPGKHTLRIFVKDDGKGIPDSFKHSIYNKFTQLESQDNRNSNGTGLGLAIAKLIVNKHNGTIDFDSTLGKGTTFYIDIPLASAQNRKKTA